MGNIYENVCKYQCVQRKLKELHRNTNNWNIILMNCFQQIQIFKLLTLYQQFMTKSGTRPIGL